MSIARFQRHGLGVFTCRVCERKARESRNPGAGDICDQCFELAGIENTLSDNGLEWTLARGYRDQAIAELRTLASKGVDIAQVWRDLIAAFTITPHELGPSTPRSR